MTLSPTHYRIVPHDVHAHLFEVRVTLESPAPEGQQFRLPVWIPGSYLIREFARHFVQVRAESNGAAVHIAKEAKDQWRVAPCAGPLTVVALVYAFDLTARGAYLDQTRGYFNGAAVFLCPVGHEQAPCTVDIERSSEACAANWRVATTLPSAGAARYGFGTYRAANYDELIDHPVETAAFELATFTAGGAPHDVAITGGRNVDLERLAIDLTKICQWQIDFFGGGEQSKAPVDRYLFQVMAVGSGYAFGGLEHRASTSLGCRRDDLPRRGDPVLDDNYLAFLGLASHEYFHTWNVKRILPAAFTPYDLTRENYTRLLWAFEGFTSYYDDLALTRCGLIPPERYLELLGRTVTAVLRMPGRLRQSAAEASFDAWIKYYRQDENSPNALVSYYTKGAVIGCALDLILRRTGQATLDDLMRALWQRYGQRGIGVPEDGIEVLASELAGTDLAEFFARYVNGTEDPPLADLLQDFGVTLHTRPARAGKDRGGAAGRGAPVTAWLGARAEANGDVTQVTPGGPAAQAGLSARDVLVAVDGLKISADAIAALQTQRQPGDRVELHAWRRDELQRLTVQLGTPPDDTAWMTLDQSATDDVLARRSNWLGAFR